jgi:integrase/recombinase XerD
MTALAPILQQFFTERLIRQRQASGHWQQTGKQPAQLAVGDIDAPLIGAFLDHLQASRGNSVTTRHARLAAIHSLFRYAAFCAPEHAALIQRVLAIPAKRADRTIVCYLTKDEMQALLNAPDRSTWHGRRDYALLHLAGQTGLRVSELTAVTIRDVHLGHGPHVACHGKGRKDRITPLTRQTVTAVRTWLDERGGAGDDPLFPSRRGTPLSSDAIERLVSKHASTAAASCPAITGKNVTPHTLRHSAAMALLHAGVDTSVIALWLGHESSETSMIYLHADMTLKERALARTTPPDSTPGRYSAPDAVLAFLDNIR